LEADADVLAPGFVAHVPDAPAPLDLEGLEVWRQFTAPFVEAFPDLRLTIQDIAAEGDTVVARVAFRGTHSGEFQGLPPTGKQVAFSSMEFNRVVDGRAASRGPTPLVPEVQLIPVFVVAPVECPSPSRGLRIRDSWLGSKAIPNLPPVLTLVGSLSPGMPGVERVFAGVYAPLPRGTNACPAHPTRLLARRKKEAPKGRGPYCKGSGPWLW